MNFDDFDFEDISDDELERIAIEEGWENEVDDNSKELAIKSMTEFFSGKEYYCGGNIPHNLLFTEENIDMVMNTSMEDGIVKIHSVLDKISSSDNTKNPIEVIHLLEKCSSKRIPKSFASGIILIYLDLCEGMKYVEEEWSIWN